MYNSKLFSVKNWNDILRMPDSWRGTKHGELLWSFRIRNGKNA